MITFAIVLLSFLNVSNVDVCSVGTLRHNPEGYFWPISYVRMFVDSADLIVRVRAAKLSPRTVRAPLFDYPDTQIRFDVIEVLKGEARVKDVVAAGRFVDNDDFNRSAIPYRIVRSAGLRGDCYASEYKRNAEYLLILKRLDRGYTPYWAPLAPLNEQIRGANDSWLRWVRDQL